MRIVGLPAWSPEWSTEQPASASEAAATATIKALNFI
jgi:hypothetical protein